MFQYAAALALARHHGAALTIDDSVYVRNREPSRIYSLDLFRVSAPRISQSALSQWVHYLSYPPAKAFLRPAAFVANLILWKSVVSEKTPYVFDPLFLKTPVKGRVSLDGYWQSPKYFTAVEQELRCQFRPVSELSGENARMLERISSQPLSVSIHVRRGDYVLARPQAILPHGYYKSAAAIAARELTNPCFYLFSDDIEWALKVVSLPGEIVPVKINDERNGHLDLRLMSACRHHIIANSSFSWWGAWLNPSLQKIVIAPRLWMGTPDSHYPDLYPPDWIVLD